MLVNRKGAVLEKKLAVAHHAIELDSRHGFAGLESFIHMLDGMDPYCSREELVAVLSKKVLEFVVCITRIGPIEAEDAHVFIDDAEAVGEGVEDRFKLLFGKKDALVQEPDLPVLFVENVLLFIEEAAIMVQVPREGCGTPREQGLFLKHLKHTLDVFRACYLTEKRGETLGEQIVKADDGLFELSVRFLHRLVAIDKHTQEQARARGLCRGRHAGKECHGGENHGSGARDNVLFFI